MRRFYRWSALLVAAAVLTGCGSYGAMSAAPSSAPGHAVGARSAAPAAEGLIASYKAVAGQDEASVARRVELVTRLGETDSDVALDFLLAEMARLDQFAEPVRTRMRDAIIEAIYELDTYDPALDDAVLEAGPGASAASMAAYADALAKKKRRKRIEMNPFKMLWKDFLKLWHTVFGKPKKKKKKKRPAPAPAPDPAPMPDPVPPAEV